MASSLTTFAVLALAVVACGGGSGASARPSPTSDAVATPQADHIVAAFGDSLTGERSSLCAGCTPWVDRYAEALASATGGTVAVQNTGRPSLRVEQLAQGLLEPSTAAAAATAADAILVAVGTSDAPWNITDDACDGEATAIELVPWHLYTDECIATEVERFRPAFDALFKRLVELRAGQPTIYRAIDRYNDWIGFEDDPKAVQVSVDYNDAWNAMICETAEANGFTCGRVSSAFNGEDGRTASGDLLADDYIHPSNEGHELIAKVVAELGFAPLVP